MSDSAHHATNERGSNQPSQAGRGGPGVVAMLTLAGAVAALAAAGVAGFMQAPILAGALAVVAVLLGGVCAATFLRKRPAAMSSGNSPVDAMRIQVALDNCKTNVMIADAGNNIVYMNGTMVEMMQNAEKDLRKEIPALDTRRLIGTNIDTFHKNPAHQQRMIAALTSTYETDITIAGRSFHLVANPIVSPTGERLGTVVEWKDETEEKAVERELNGSLIYVILIIVFLRAKKCLY